MVKAERRSRGCANFNSANVISVGPGEVSGPLLWISVEATAPADRAPTDATGVTVRHLDITLLTLILYNVVRVIESAVLARMGMTASLR